MANDATTSPDRGNSEPFKLRGTWIDTALTEANKARERRARVLAHPDLAGRLCDPPMRLSSPEVWTGHVPPARVDILGSSRPNNSPNRRQIIEVLRAVAEREQEAGE